MEEKNSLKEWNKTHKKTNSQTQKHRGSHGEGKGDGGENPDEMPISHEADPVLCSALGKGNHTCHHHPEHGNCTVLRNFPSLPCCETLF